MESVQTLSSTISAFATTWQDSATRCRHAAAQRSPSRALRCLLSFEKMFAVSTPSSTTSRVPHARALRSADRRHVKAFSIPIPVRCSAAHSADDRVSLTRRGVLSTTLVASLLPAFAADAGEVSDSKMVGAYLPEAASEPGFYAFVASSTRTPALRAGALNPYRVNIPAQWKEAPVSNARSGNYCQPRCDEATTEVQFTDPGSGVLQLIIIPTTKLLIAKNEPTIEDVGEIYGILDAISPAITGSVAVEREEVQSATSVAIDGKSYYKYELLTPFADAGVHSLSVVSTNKNYVFIATIGASEKQWARAEGELRKIVDSFRC